MLRNRWSAGDGAVVGRSGDSAADAEGDGPVGRCVTSPSRCRAKYTLPGWPSFGLHGKECAADLAHLSKPRRAGRGVTSTQSNPTNPLCSSLCEPSAARPSPRPFDAEPAGTIDRADQRETLFKQLLKPTLFGESILFKFFSAPRPVSKSSPACSATTPVSTTLL